WMSVIVPATVALPMDLADQARAIGRRWAVVACAVAAGLVAAGGVGWAPSTIPGWMLAGGVIGSFGGALALLAERYEGRAPVAARSLVSWAGTATLMLVLWVVIKALLFQSFSIPSSSMAPALRPGDRVLVSKLSYRLHDVHRVTSSFSSDRRECRP